MKSISGLALISLLSSLALSVGGCFSSQPKHVLRYDVTIDTECGPSNWVFDIDRTTTEAGKDGGILEITPIGQIARTVYSFDAVSANCSMSELEVVSTRPSTFSIL
jgi:hypothetical protein